LISESAYLHRRRDAPHSKFKGDSIPKLNEVIDDEKWRKWTECGAERGGTEEYKRW